MEFWQKVYKSYQTEINFLRREGNKLLEEIKQHETNMNQKKQQQLKPNEQDLYHLNEMIKKMLKIMAFIEGYRHFQLMKMTMTNDNILWFYSKTNNYYEILLQRFMLRIRQLQYRKIMENEESVDFTIN